jgi:hypothetical protein
VGFGEADVGEHVDDGIVAALAHAGVEVDDSADVLDVVLDVIELFSETVSVENQIILRFLIVMLCHIVSIMNLTQYWIILKKRLFRPACRSAEINVRSKSLVHFSCSKLQKEL